MSATLVPIAASTSATGLSCGTVTCAAASAASLAFASASAWALAAASATALVSRLMSALASALMSALASTLPLPSAAESQASRRTKNARGVRMVAFMAGSIAPSTRRRRHRRWDPREWGREATQWRKGHV